MLKRFLKEEWELALPFTIITVAAAVILVTAEYNRGWIAGTVIFAASILIGFYIWWKQNLNERYRMAVKLEERASAALNKSFYQEVDEKRLAKANEFTNWYEEKLLRA